MSEEHPHVEGVEHTLSSEPRPRLVEFLREHSSPLIGGLMLLLCLSVASHGFSKTGWSKAKEITDVLLNLLQMLALITGGSWAYHKYVRGRTFHERLIPEVRGRLIHLDEKLYLMVTIQLKNVGQSVIGFRPGASSLVLFGYVESTSTNIVDVNDRRLAQLPMLTARNLSIEPSGILEETCLIFVPEAVEIALRLEIEIVSANDRGIWYASSLVEQQAHDMYHKQPLDLRR
jgi:hypothetical protein